MKVVMRDISRWSKLRSAPVGRKTHAEAVPLVSVVPDALCMFIACAATEIFGLMQTAEPCGPMTMP